jgi:fumarate reductase flavoprotein subunit
MLWDGHIPGVGGMHMTLARQPWLYVNVLGERYANEDAPFGYTANQDIKQPTSMKWAVWDGKWADDVMQLHGTVCEAMHPPFWSDESYQDYMDQGVIIEADTLEALAEKMEVPVDAFLATVERYNELYELGQDLDFGKDPAKLTSIVEGPFGAAKVGTGILVTCDGLRVNTDLQVLNAEGEPIPGLYAAGNASGDFFANDYPIDTHGLSHGRALTFGWLAGESAAKA